MMKKLMDTSLAEEIFHNWQEATIWACLDGIMGSVYVDDLEKPKSAMAYLGCFCFLAGTPNEELLNYKPAEAGSFEIMVPQSEEWSQLIGETYKENSKKVTRYALSKKDNHFDKIALQGNVDCLNPNYTLHAIDEKLYKACLKEEWCRDLVENYKDYDIYKKYGIGVIVMNNDEIIAGASSYATYNNGIDIEIDTKETYRRQGLATICGSKLILDCLERNMNPCWDAQNVWSRDLSVKLGYQFEGEYKVFEVFNR